MRQYVETIAHFFHNAKIAIALLEDYEYEIISELATRWYYDSIHIYPADIYPTDEDYPTDGDK